LTIKPEVTGLKLHDRETFRASRIRSDGVSASVSASWSTDRPDVLRIDAVSGEAIGEALGESTVTAALEGRTVSRRIQVVPDLSGEWSGQMRTDQTRLSGPGPFRAVFNWVTLINFSLAQNHDKVSGTGTVFLTAGPVQASITSTGAVSLRGSFRTTEGWTAEITEWGTQLDASGSAQVGHLTIIERFTNAWGPQVIQDRSEIVTLTRQPQLSIR
jgi:hypothetical protein